MSDLNFYIIYTPKSFHLLKFAVKSLLFNSKYDYTLVGNGLSRKEAEEIFSFSKKNKRLHFIDMPGNVAVPHGTALMHLLQHHHKNYFCFCDSDIFGVSDFTDELNLQVKQSDVFSSCKPLEWLTKKSPAGYRGHCTISPSGNPVSLTYFSIYKTKSLKQTIERYEISLERYMRREQVPQNIQQLINIKDQHNWKFNTAKLVNLMQSTSGMRIEYKEIKGLLHLGGISRYSQHHMNNNRKVNMNDVIAIDRLNSRHFFYELLSVLSTPADTHCLPTLKVQNKPFYDQIKKAEAKIVELFKLMKTLDIESL